MPLNLRSLLPILVFDLVLTIPASAQVQNGTPPFGSYTGGPDVINLANLNARLSIPILHKAGRGTDFTYDLNYDSSVWFPVTTGSTTTWTSVINWGWAGSVPTETGYLAYHSLNTTCQYYDTNLKRYITEHYTQYSNWTYFDSFGIAHPMYGGLVQDGGAPDCGPSYSNTGAARDGSGYTMKVDGGPDGSVTARDGSTSSNLPLQAPAPKGGWTDRNGNQITVSSSGSFYDTLSSTTPVLSVTGSGTPTSPVKLTYTSPSGGSPSFQMNYTQYTVRTYFQVSGIVDPAPASVSLVSSIVLPDGSEYSFAYEKTPSAANCTPLSGTFQSNCVTARLASVTLPTGGSITYSYTGGNNGILSDGSAATLTRTLSDGGSWSAQWTYAQVKNSGAASTTTVTDPQSNVSTIQFQGIYETHRVVNSGSSSVLLTTNTCYNASASPCTGTAIALPITQRNVLSQFGTSGSQVLQVSKYNSYGLPTEEDDYDYASGAPTTILRKTFTTYAALGNGIVSMPATVTVCTASGSSPSCGNAGTPVAQTTYTYDQGTLGTSSSTPQHIAVSGSRGNATTVASLVSGSTTLNKTFTYYDTGTLNTATDANNAVTTYIYADATSTCGNAFPTSVSEPLGLSKSFTWKCTGAVLTQVTDENGKNTTTSYTDTLFWRPASVTDATSAVTTYSYATSSPYNWSEASLSIVSGTSAADVRTTVDGLGRPILQQRRQGPSASHYDTVETDYDSLGLVKKVTLPFSTTAGATNSSAVGTTTQYDALSRVKNSTDSGSGTTSYTYTNNDALVAVGPPPTGENLKQRQLEYDGLSRLASVCEITGAAKSGTCGQTTTATGYWTKYTYDILGDLTGVTQNAQPNGSPQTRTYNYDGLSRMTSETNPESGTTVYTYETMPPSCYNFGDNQSGNLTGKTDANGNTNCFHHDSLNRLTDVGSSGPNAAICKRFRYDVTSNGVKGSPPPGVSVGNINGRLMEAETDNCGAWPPTPITDEWFGYTARGEISDIYQSSPNSGGYYHSNQQYWPNGAIHQISGLPTLPTFTYGVDPEGRIATLTASSGQNPLTNTTYNSAGSPTGLTFGSGDSDAFTYDPNTNRMIKYQFNVNTQSFIGSLTWNANGTLATQNITDPFNATDTQNCSYSHDDLVRISSVNCGSAWSQTFNYDPFGNLTKSGTMSFQPTYSSANNRMISLPGFTPTYDADGNVLNDGSHAYTWDGYREYISVDGSSVIYDALGRMTELSAGGSQKFYLPDGSQVLFQGQVARRAGLNLPGGARVNYDSSHGGLLDYAHPDHLGSLRLFTTPTRAFSSSQAYAPFGEPFAVSSITPDQAFTGQTSNFALDLYIFPARQYSDQGRWISPDPAGLAVVDPSDPQSWNRYAYVENSPLIYTDPTGMNKVDCTVNGAPSICSVYGIGGGGGGGGVPVYGIGTCTGTTMVNGDPTDYDYSCSVLVGYAPVGGGGGGGGVGVGKKKTKSNCGVQRAALGLKGLVSYGVSYAKLNGALASVATTPATGPVGIAGALYALVGAGGNFAAGTVQILGAATGRVDEASNAANTVSTVTTLAGFTSYVVTKGNLETASTWAALESLGTAGFNGGLTGHFIDESATATQKLFLRADLGQAATDAVGIETSPGCTQP